MRPIAKNCRPLWSTSQRATCPAPKILRALADPVWQSILAAPRDDEPETDEERAEVEAARKETAGTSHQEVLREFGV